MYWLLVFNNWFVAFCLFLLSSRARAGLVKLFNFCKVLKCISLDDTFIVGIMSLRQRAAALSSRASLLRISELKDQPVEVVCMV